MNRSAVLSGLGAALPPRVVTNDMLSERLDTNDEWIRSRTGVRERRFADPGTATGDLAVEAGRRALKSAGAEQVDLVILATATPDQPLPATAPWVAARLGLGTIPAFDLAAVCAGFVYALSIASAAIAAGQADKVLVIGADTFSSIISPTDRSTAVIFGDGAGGVVLRAGERDEPGALLGFELGSDGTGLDLVGVPGGGSRQRAGGGVAPQPETAWLSMQGRPIFRRAVDAMADSTLALADRIGWPIGSVDRLVAHQANVRILHAVADALGMPHERAVVHLDRVGNTSSASVPLALADAAANGVLLPGQRVMLTTFGAGLAWGSAALTWPEVEAV
jgi:3-oxoacyl-[acyl-carrier-protein] synthase III